MKSSTSWPWSRKYSAIVRPDRPTRRRAPGGSFIWPKHERDLVDDSAVARLRLAHLEQEVVALARALADAGEHRHAAVLAGEVRDQLLDQHRLADAGAAEEADLAAAHVRGDQVDDLDARLEDLDLRREVLEVRRVAVDRPALGRGVAALARRSDRRARSRAGRASRGRRAPRSARPVSTTSVPRARPSVVSIATARTRSSPRCCCTSATRSPPSGRVMRSAE